MLKLSNLSARSGILHIIYEILYKSLRMTVCPNSLIKNAPREVFSE
jgi:hypothetical protein